MKNMLSKKRPMQKVIHIITITKPLGIYENAERPCKTLGSVVFLKKLPQILLISLFSKTTLNKYILSKGKRLSESFPSWKVWHNNICFKEKFRTW